MAVLSYFCVENPFRAHSLLKEAKLFTSFGFLTALAFVFGSITSSGYAEPRSGVPWPEWPQESSEYWQVTQTDGNIGQVILMGDSHMAMLAESATGHTERLGLNFIDATAGGCPVFTGVTRTGTDCDALFQADRLTRASRAGPSFVILGGRYPLALENSRFDNQEGGVEPGSAVNYVPTNEFNFVDTNRESILREALIGALEELLRQGHTIVLVYPIPEVGWDVPQEIGNRARLSQAGSITGFPVSQWFQQRLLPGIEAWPLEKPVTTSYTKYQERTESTFDALDSITSERIIRVFPHHLFCETKEVGRCTTHDEKDIFYADDDHLSLSGANLVSDEIFAKITEIIPR